MTAAAQDGVDTRAVIERHIARRLDGDLEGDLTENYDPAVVMLSRSGAREGFAGVRAEAADLARSLPDAAFEIVQLVTRAEFGYERWRATSRGGEVCDGVDAFVVRDGRIVAQTIHYTVTPPD